MKRPIGVFDSGVGGLTVLRALHAKLPEQDFIYVGDTARVPYGRKPKEMVRGFASEIANFLLGLGAEGIVIACNTACAASLPGLANELPVPVWGTIDPGVEAARRQTRTGLVGVIGTKGTIASGVYQRKLEALGLRVWARACPLFVHLVEEGLAEEPEAEVVARHYLGDCPPVDTIILGCTHYPLLRNTIQRVVGDSVALVSSADVTAEVVTNAWGYPTAGTGRVVHYVTGDVLAYEHTARWISGVEGDMTRLDLSKLQAGVAK